MKTKLLVIAAVFASFFALGMPDGAFGVAWPKIRYDMGVDLDMAYILVLLHSIFYSAVSSQMGRMEKRLSLASINAIGLCVIAVSMLGFSLAPNMIGIGVMSAILGGAMSFVDAGVNAFAAKNLSAKHMNWLHCFWGFGASFSPIIMSQMILIAGWRAGYVSIALLQSVVAIFVLVSIFKGAWVMKNADGEPHESEGYKASEHKHLKSRVYPFLQMLIFLIYAGTEYSITFWTPSVMIEGRGFDISTAGMYTAAYLGAITGGRVLAGFVTKWVSNKMLIRVGLLLAASGLVVMIFSGHIIGMALTGFGLAPVFPSLMHETPLRFEPKILTKLVGYQISAVGVGIAFTTFGMGRVLTRISLDSLFPVVLFGVAALFILNEIIEFGMYRLKHGSGLC